MSGLVHVSLGAVIRLLGNRYVGLKRSRLELEAAVQSPLSSSHRKGLAFSFFVSISYACLLTFPWPPGVSERKGMFPHSDSEP